VRLVDDQQTDTAGLKDRVAQVRVAGERLRRREQHLRPARRHRVEDRLSILPQDLAPEAHRSQLQLVEAAKLISEEGHQGGHHHDQPLRKH